VSTPLCEQRLEAALREAVTAWRFYPVVLALQAMRGIQFVAAIGMVSELGDLTRFGHPRQLMAWLGVTPSEHSSGGKRRQGSVQLLADVLAHTHALATASARSVFGFVMDVGARQLRR